MLTDLLEIGQTMGKVIGIAPPAGLERSALTAWVAYAMGVASVELAVLRKVRSIVKLSPESFAFDKPE